MHNKLAREFSSPVLKNLSGWLLFYLILLLTLSACTQAIHSAPAAPLADQITPGPHLPLDTQQPEVSPIPSGQPRQSDPQATRSPSDPDFVLAQTTTSLPDGSKQDLLPAAGVVTTMTPCGAGQCIAPNTLILARPIAEPNNDQIDTSYRFGSTQKKDRAPHHGVEFTNPPGIPVLASAGGVVMVAGNDRTTQYGPYNNFYGNLVILRHDFPPESLAGFPALPTPVYTLYAHLSEISVKNGQHVKAGQEVGKVGMTGSATGNHLHFEVRLGENTYQAAHNPELWLLPKMDENNQYQGALAGQVIDGHGETIAVQNITIQYLPDGPEGAVGRKVYIDSYEEEALLGRLPWQESFALGGLPAGWYRVSFAHLGLQTRDVQVLPGQLTVVVFSLD